MSQTDHSSCGSIPESESMLENDCEDIYSISNVKYSFQPYQGEPLAMASDEESSEDEAEKDGIQPSVLKRRLNRNILICFYKHFKHWECEKYNHSSGCAPRSWIHIYQIKATALFSLRNSLKSETKSPSKRKKVR